MGSTSRRTPPPWRRRSRGGRPSAVSGERVRDELSALLAGGEGGAAVRDLAVWGALAVVLPELDALRGVQQNPYHHLDVFEHTLEALTYVGAWRSSSGASRIWRRLRRRACPA